MSNLLLERIIDELRDYSSDLLEVGAAPLLSIQRTRTTSRGAHGALLSGVSFLTALVPRLIAEAEDSEAPNRVTEHYSFTPTRARLSRRAADYDFNGQALLPTRWVKTVPLLEPDLQALRWLLSLFDLQEERLRRLLNRTEKQADDARMAKRAGSLWADADSLQSILDELREAQSFLDHARLAVQRAAGRNLQPSARLPHPFPNTSAWTSLHRLYLRLTQPEKILPQYLGVLLCGEARLADAPYLYQRWVGLKLLQTFEGLGWQIREDPIGPLFLGGVIPLRRQGITLRLYVEPRLTQRRHESGFRSTTREVTPDFLFVTPGHGGPDAWVLDATLSQAEDVLRDKGRYLHLIEIQRLALVAGCPVQRSPRLAWAAAPLSRNAKDFHGEGRTGAVPMSPIEWNPEPIRRWIKDLCEHALVWGHFQRHRRNRRRRAMEEAEANAQGEAAQGPEEG